MAKTEQWHCEGGHVLGVISWNGIGIPQLMLYRHAVDLDAERPEQVDVIGPVRGLMHVRCDVEGCDSVKVWRPNQLVMTDLLLDLADSEFSSLMEKVDAAREQLRNSKTKRWKAIFE